MAGKRIPNSRRKRSRRGLCRCDALGALRHQRRQPYPRRSRTLVTAARAAVADYNVAIGIHCHNDGELAVANSLAAIDAGASQVQGTINGIGERCGNVDLISMIANLAIKKTRLSRLLGGRSNPLTELSRYVYETANLQWRNSQPFVGQSAFAHKGGMHVHAINKSASTYEHIDPALVGNERRILISELSGRSNIAAMTSKHNLVNNRELMDKILAEVVASGKPWLSVRICGGLF
jgi:2-isopropylmalate synthase